MAKLSLGSMISSKIKKEKLGGEVFSPSYSTGISILDYRNGRFEGEEKVIGISGGKILSVVGNSGSGKSSLAYTIAGTILRTDANAQIVHLDYERAANKGRISTLSGIPIDQIAADSDTYTFLNSDISSESLYGIVKAIHEVKMDNKADFTVEKMFNGKKVSYLTPTVLIVDSLATMTPKNIIDEDELSGSMSASGIAKTNNAIFKRLSNFITDANITLIVINHITTKLTLGTPTKPALNFLKMDESLPGGTSSIFLSDTLIKVTPGTKLEEEKDYGIKGFISEAMFIKSRSNSSGRKVSLVFDQEKGFNNLLTNIQFLKEAKLLQGSGHGYFIETCPTVKFKMKNVQEIYRDNEEFRVALDAYMQTVYTEFLSAPPVEKEEDFMLVECLDAENEIWLGNDGLKYKYSEETEECSLIEE